MTRGYWAFPTFLICVRSDKKCELWGIRTPLTNNQPLFVLNLLSDCQKFIRYGGLEPPHQIIHLYSYQTCFRTVIKIVRYGGLGPPHHLQTK